MTSFEKLTVKELYEILLTRARYKFPKLTVTGEIVSIENEVVIRVMHHRAIEEMPWVTIVPITILWRAELRHGSEVAIQARSVKDILDLYNSMIDIAIGMKLFTLEEFALVK